MSLTKEIEEGNIEYKRYLCNLEPYKIERLISQMRWRIVEGEGEAIYYLGVNDNGTIFKMSDEQKEETLKNFNIIVEKSNATIVSIEMSIYIKAIIRF